MEKTVLVTGTLGYDYIMDFPGFFADRIMPDKIHKISLSFLVDRLNKQLGGTAGNIAYTLNLLGITPYILSVAGNDFSPYSAFLDSCGISTRGIKIVDNEVTGSYFVVTDKEDNQIGSFYSGATKEAHTLSLSDVKPKASIVVIAPTDPRAVVGYVNQCQASALPYLFDPAFNIDLFTGEQLKTAISGAKILIANDYEMSLIEKKTQLTHPDLCQLVPILITTLGSKGATIESAKKTFHIPPAKPKDTSDPTGAGDAFRGGFLGGFIRGLDLQTCGQMGATAVVYTVEAYGTMTHKFTLDEFALRYRENYHQNLKLQ